MDDSLDGVPGDVFDNGIDGALTNLEPIPAGKTYANSPDLTGIGQSMSASDLWQSLSTLGQPAGAMMDDGTDQLAATDATDALGYGGTNALDPSNDALSSGDGSTALDTAPDAAAAAASPWASGETWFLVGLIAVGALLARKLLR